MRRRLRNFLPIVLMALTVQIFAPIGACWAASIAASDPLHNAAICAGSAAMGGQADQTGDHRAHHGSCSSCCVAQAAATIDTPQATLTTPHRLFARVVWLDSAPVLFDSRTHVHAQARAPPSFS